MKALITFAYTNDELKALKDLGYEIIFKDERDFSYTDEMKDAEVLVCFNPFNKLDLDMFPNLKWIQLLSAGINQVPAEKVINQNILLTNNRGCYSIPIAEWIVLKILEMIKNSKQFYEKQENKIWKMDTSLLELVGKTVGFVGTGSIAQEAAKRLKGFDVNIIGFNTKGTDTQFFNKCYEIDKINESIKDCDFVVVAAPYTDKTHQLINKDVFDNMKYGTYLVNIARGSIIDEQELIKNLESGKIRKAALDVFQVEPLPKDSPLWDMKNVLISPHNSWSSEMISTRRYEIAYKNMKKYINREELVNVIDLSKGY